MSTIYTYECKCRKCGEQTESFVGDASQFSLEDFRRYAYEKCTYPEVTFCKKCLQLTVKDVIAFREPENDKP
jgi:hypothetical protein